jgi:UDP-N-acetylglucosamine:LPS N-acetylglucosamine transferase
MPDLLVAADLAVCRAGASTVTELAVAGLPSVLVPLPHAPRDHQRANTAEVAEAGGAIVLDDAEITADRLADVLEPLIADPGRRREMAAATVSVARPNAAAAVAEVLIDQGALAGRLREIGPAGPVTAPPDDRADRDADPNLERNEPA